MNVTGLRKAYGDFVAVHELTFALEPGQILGLVGPNGAGKTTTMRTIAGILPCAPGMIDVAGCDVATNALQAKHRLGYVPDDPRLFDNLTVWEHLAFAASAYRVHDWQHKADALLQEFDLESRRDALAHHLSRGMRQKVAISCAYLHDPRVVLFDEPLTGLDPKGIRAIQASINRRTEAGAAVMVSSHLLGLVEDLCTHVLVLHKGRAEMFANTEEIASAVHDGSGGRGLEQLFFSITHDDEDAPP